MPQTPRTPNDSSPLRLSPKKPAPHPDPAFQRLTKATKQAERMAEQARRVAIADEIIKRQLRGLLHVVTDREREAVRVETMKKKPRWTKTQWDALRTSESPVVAAFLQEQCKLGTKRPKLPRKKGLDENRTNRV